MERKDCPICSGVCNSVWERDILAVSNVVEKWIRNFVPISYVI